MTENDLLREHARVVRTSVAVVSQVGTKDLGRPTPCANWTLADLLGHMTVQHDGFAAAACGNGADPTLWEVRALGPDPIGAYAEAADRVVRAFARDGVLEQEFALPEINPRTTFPGRQAIGFHLIDYVVHGWDVARTIDVPFAPDPDVLDAGLTIAAAVPDGNTRRQPGAAFAPARAVPDDAPAIDRIVAHLGRSPTWRSEASGSPNAFVINS